MTHRIVILLPLNAILVHQKTFDDYEDADKYIDVHLKKFPVEIKTQKFVDDFKGKVLQFPLRAV